MLRRSAQNADAYNKAASALKAEPVGHVTTVRGLPAGPKGRAGTRENTRGGAAKAPIAWIID
jgi:hypothetical protein